MSVCRFTKLLLGGRRPFAGREGRCLTGGYPGPVEDGTAVERVKRRRPFCADLSRTREEPLGATASRIDNWILVEYRGAWRRDILGGSLLSPRLKTHLREHLELLRPARLLFVKQPERRAESGRRVFLASTTPGAERLLGLEVEHQDDLRDVDLADALAGGDAPVPPDRGSRSRRLHAREARPLLRAVRRPAVRRAARGRSTRRGVAVDSRRRGPLRGQRRRAAAGDVPRACSAGRHPGAC